MTISLHSLHYFSFVGWKSLKGGTRDLLNSLAQNGTWRSNVGPFIHIRFVTLSPLCQGHVHASCPCFPAVGHFQSLYLFQKKVWIYDDSGNWIATGCMLIRRIEISKSLPTYFYIQWLKELSTICTLSVSAITFCKKAGRWRSMCVSRNNSNLLVNAKIIQEKRKIS